MYWACCRAMNRSHPLPVSIKPHLYNAQFTKHFPRGFLLLGVLSTVSTPAAVGGDVRIVKSSPLSATRKDEDGDLVSSILP